MTQSLKNILIEGNRYDDIINLLNGISDKNCKEYPLHHPYVDKDNSTYWRADGSDVRTQARLLVSLLESDSCGGTDDSFIELGAYVQSTCEIYLINYAVAASHNKAPEHGLETIRQWEVLRSLIDCWSLTEEEWYIPEAWQGNKA